MKPITEFIVEIPKSHNDEVTLKSSGIVLKFDVKFNQGEHTNRIGKVIACPAKFDSIIKEGYIVIIDKNLVTFQVHSDSLVNKSTFLIDDEKGWYRVPPNMVYLYKEKMEDQWTCPAPYVFVKPIKSVELKKGDFVYKAFDNYKGYKEQYGKVAFLNKRAESFGLQKGDTVFYKKDREYEFKIDGEMYYHMETDDILMTVE